MNMKTEVKVPTAIRDDLLAAGDVGIHQVIRFGAGLVVCYTAIATKQKRIACYIDGETPAEFDLVVDVDVDAD
jgi:hypothetical protein